MKKNSAEWIAILLSVAGIVISAWTAQHVFENLPHIEDEMAYTWQAQVITAGKITLPSPPCPDCFLVPFVVDHDGLRFGKYPLAWPVMLSFGIRLGLRHLVNPLLAGAAVWLTYRLGKKVLGEGVGVMAALLTLTSPLFLMNSGTLLSHPFGLVLSLVFAISWLDTFQQPADLSPPPRLITALAASLSLGLLALTRPLTAAGIALPFFFHGLYLLWRGERRTRMVVLGIGLGAGVIASLHFLWQYAVTGQALLNPYTLWWSYDSIGFGPGIGRQVGGYTPAGAYANLLFNLKLGTHDLFGWAGYSWIFLPFGLYAIRKNAGAWLITAVFPSLVLAYCFYWIAAALLGPRYYYEALYSLTLLSAAGIAFLTGLPFGYRQRAQPWSLRQELRPLAVVTLVGLLICANLLYYAPRRVGDLHGLYGVSRVHLAPFQNPAALEHTPALILVHEQETWIEYGRLIELESPFLDSPFIFAYDPFPEEEQLLRDTFPERKVFHYYADDPFIFYESQRD